VRESCDYSLSSSWCPSTWQPIGGRGRDVLYAGVDGFGKVLIGGEGGVGEAVFVLTSLIHSSNESFVVGCIR
jgi:hypothetical protein